MKSRRSFVRSVALTSTKHHPLNQLLPNRTTLGEFWMSQSRHLGSAGWRYLRLLPSTWWASASIVWGVPSRKARRIRGRHGACAVHADWVGHLRMEPRSLRPHPELVRPRSPAHHVVQAWAGGGSVERHISLCLLHVRLRFRRCPRNSGLIGRRGADLQQPVRRRRSGGSGRRFDSPRGCDPLAPTRADRI